MYNKLPQYVFRKSYLGLFLFSDTEISYNNGFNLCIQEFSNRIGGNEITVEIMNFKQIEEYAKFSIIKIPNTDTRSLSKLADIPLIDDQSVEDLLGCYYIFDNTREWEFYVSLVEETAVFGCSKRCIKVFKDIFKPYKEITLDNKLNDIYNFCKSKDERDAFIGDLCKNYNWTV